MRVAYLTRFDVTDRASVSALGGAGYASYYIAQTLETMGVSLTRVNGLPSSLSLATRLTSAFYRRVYHQNYNIAANPTIIKRQAKYVAQKLAGADYDIILTRIVLPLARLQVNKPVVVWTDGSARGLFDFYPQLTNLSERSKRETLAMELAALEHCSLIIYSSEWAASHAPDRIDRRKIKIVPFGANCECDRTVGDIQAIAEMKPMRPYRLLFVGGAWNRKGGLIACQVAKALSDFGYPTTLTVIGRKPDIPKEFGGVVNLVGFLDQSRAQGQQRWSELMRESHFLILPSRADCSPHVLAEANSFGLPCLTTNVGGIPGIIRDGVNGKLFRLEADPRDYCDFIVSQLEDPQRYQRLMLASFQEFQTRLNWRVACQQVEALLEGLMTTT